MTDSTQQGDKNANKLLFDSLSNQKAPKMIEH